MRNQSVGCDCKSNGSDHELFPLEDDEVINVLIALHKPYWVPSDEIYIPVHVGAAGKPTIDGLLRDDVGDNISIWNSRYSELTALYWGWKNLNADFIGLVHYRRHFAGTGDRGTLSRSDALKLLEKAPVILPKRRHYYIETVGGHYSHTFSAEQLDILRSAIALEDIGCVPFFDKHMRERSSHIWNMSIMRYDILASWCQWLFPILERVESEIDFSCLTPFESRLIGRLSERLIDPWLQYNGITYTECPVVSMEGNKYHKKIIGMLKAKFLGIKYDQSF